MSPSLLALLWRHGQQRQVDDFRDNLRAMRHAVREAVADVIVPALTGKPRRTRDTDAPAQAGLVGAALEAAVAGLSLGFGAGPTTAGSAHPGLVMTGAPGHPFRPS